MYAGHFAAGLAIKTAEPRAPMAAVMGLVFLPDLLWLGLSMAGVEIVTPGMWFDGWSHSIASIVLQAALVAVLSWRHGVAVSAGARLRCSQPLGSPTCRCTPRRSSGIPMRPQGSGISCTGGQAYPSLFGKPKGWWVEAAVVVCGALIYLAGSRRVRVGAATAGASAIVIASLQITFG